MPAATSQPKDDGYRIQLPCAEHQATGIWPPARSAHNLVATRAGSLMLLAGDSGVACQRFSDTWLLQNPTEQPLAWQDLAQTHHQQQQQQKQCIGSCHSGEVTRVSYSKDVSSSSVTGSSSSSSGSYTDRSNSSSSSSVEGSGSSSGGYTARSNSTAAVVGDWLLLFGGWDTTGLHPLAQLEAFNLRMMTWHSPLALTTPHVPEPQCHDLVISAHIELIDSNTKLPSSSPECRGRGVGDARSPSTSSSNRGISSGPSPRGQPAAASNTAGTALYLFGGWDGQQRYNDLWMLHVQGNSSQPPVQGNCTHQVVQGNSGQPAVQGNNSQPDVQGNSRQPAVQGNSRQPAVQGNSSQPAVQGHSRQPDVQGQRGQPAVQGNSRQPDVQGSSSQPNVQGNSSQPAVQGNSDWTQVGIQKPSSQTHHQWFWQLVQPSGSVTAADGAAAVSGGGVGLVDGAGVESAAAEPCPRADHVMVCWHYCDDGIWKDILVVFGGSSSRGLLNDTWLFDVRSNKWSQAFHGGSPPCPRSSSAAAITDDTLLLHGGQTPAGVLDDMYLLQLNNLTWIQVDVGPITHPLCRHSMAISDMSAWIFGGYTGSSNSSSLLQIDLQPVLQLQRSSIEDLASRMACRGCDKQGDLNGSAAAAAKVVKVLNKKASPAPLRLSDLPNADEAARLPQWKQVRQLHQAAFTAGCDMYIDPKTGYSVFTGKYLKQRECCGNKCRHCPWGWKNVAQAGTIQW